MTPPNIQRRMVIACAVPLAIAGASVLLGASTGTDVLRSLLPEVGATSVTTAVGFLIGAGALLASTSVRRRRLVPWLAAALVALGAAAMPWGGAHPTPPSPSPSPSPAGTAASLALAPVWASCLVAAGIALCLSHWPGRRRVLVADLLAAAILVVCFNSITAYISGLHDVYQTGANDTSLLTAIGFLLLGCGSTLTNRDFGIGALLADESAGGRQLRQMLPAVTLVPLLMHAAAVTGLLSGWYEAEIAHSILTTGNACILAAVTIWSSQRTYLLDAARTRLLLDLAERDVHLRSTFENAFVGIGLVDRLGRWVRVNDRLCSIVGAPPDQLVGRLARDRLPAGLGDAVAELRAGQAGPTRRLSVEDRGLALDAGLTRLGRDVAGEDHGVLVMLHDVTELRQQAQQLLVRERALSSIIAGVTIADARQPDQPIVYVNQAFTSITGYGAEEAVGRNPRFLSEGLRDQAGLDEVRQALAEGRACVAQLRNRRKDGTEFWNRLSLSPVHAPSGALTHWVGVQEDITAEIAAADEREVLLKAAVRGRERAERASRARDALLAIVSHELRSPLNGIRLWSSLLAKQPDPATVARAARHIDVNIAAQSRLIADLVDVSRIESGQLELELAPIDVAALIARVFDSLRPAAEEKGLITRLDRAGGPIVVDADAGRLEQVLRNLMENAIKFTDRGGDVAVAIESDGTNTRITVTDTGKGMSELQQRHAFELFWQGDRTDTRPQGGLGLGLYLVRQIVERHGGRIELHSSGRGKGTRAVLELPLGTRVLQAAPRPVAVPTDGRASPSDILVVDDEVSTAEALALALRYRGYSVRMASNADAALAMIRARPPRVLVSDIMMPGKSGVALVAAVRDHERGAGGSTLHAIAISGRGNPSDRRRLLRAGFDDFMPKPVEIEGLVGRIERALESPAAPVADGSRILIVTADRDQGRRIADRLSRDGRDAVLAASADEARSLSGRTRPDVVIVGHLPRGEIVDFARELQEERADHSIRTIAVGTVAGAVAGAADGLADVFDVVLPDAEDLEELANRV